VRIQLQKIQSTGGSAREEYSLYQGWISGRGIVVALGKPIGKVWTIHGSSDLEGVQNPRELAIEVAGELQAVLVEVFLQLSSLGTIDLSYPSILQDGE
jgi:hypothetical protein